MFKKQWSINSLIVIIIFLYDSVYIEHKVSRLALTNGYLIQC
jgi:hypothetical protein